MSTASEITRLTEARNTIRDKLIDLGLAASTDKLDDLAIEIDGITNRGAVSATVQEGDTYTIPAGYHNGSGTVSGVSGGGNYSLQSKQVTPTKQQQAITPDSGYYGLSDVTVSPIPEAYQNVSAVTATASDVLANKIIVNAAGSTLTGTMTNRGAVSKTLDATSGNQTYTVPSGYHNGSGTVSIVLESSSVTPTKSAQTVVPTTGKVLSSVTVAAIPSAYQDVTSVNAVASDVLSGKKIVDATGSEVTGTMINRGAVSKTLDATAGNQTYTVPIGYHNGSGTVSIVLESKSTTPTKSSQTITPTSGKVLSAVTVDPIPSAYQDITGTTADETAVLAGCTFVNSEGVMVTGSMYDHGIFSGTLYPGHSVIELDQGFYSSGMISIVLESKTATPSTASQSITPTNGKVLSEVTVDPIPSAYQDVTSVTATASEVLASKVFVNANGSQITGTMTNRGTVSHVLDATKNNQVYNIPSGYHNGNGTVNIVLEGKSVTPSTTLQTVTPTSGKVLEKVEVAAIPSQFGDTTGDTGVAADVLSGKYVHTIVNGAASKITGSMANNGSITATIDGITTTSYSVPSGYTSGGSVSLTSDIEDALAAI